MYINISWNLFSGEEQVCWLHLSITISWHCDTLLGAIHILATCSLSCVCLWKVPPVSLEHLHFYGKSCCHLLLLYQGLRHPIRFHSSVAARDKRLQLNEIQFWCRPSRILSVSLVIVIVKCRFQICVHQVLNIL